MRLIVLITLCIISFYAISVEKVPTVLISIDGLSSQQLEKIKPRTLNLLAEKGLSSKALLPVYPTKTFPNHLSIVTGAYPAQHGIIHNNFYDSNKNSFYKMGEAGNDPTWLKVKPIWVLAEEQNIKTASYFWPESDAELFTTRPSYYFPYKHETDNKERLEQVIKWLEMPLEQKPRFITSYFSIVDSANHDFGGFSEQSVEAIAEVDRLLKWFLQTLAEKNIAINLVLVSDHGTEYIKRKIPQYTLIPKDIYKSVKVINGQTQLLIYGKNNTRFKKFTRQLKQKAKGRYSVYSKGEYPAHWHFNEESENGYVPDLIVNAKPGIIFTSKDYDTTATHGYDLAESENMEAIFIAYGPNLIPDKLEKFENIHVFSLLAQLIGVEITDDRPSDFSVFQDNFKP